MNKCKQNERNATVDQKQEKMKVKPLKYCISLNLSLTVEMCVLVEENEGVRFFLVMVELVVAVLE